MNKLALTPSLAFTVASDAFATTVVDFDPISLPTGKRVGNGAVVEVASPEATSGIGAFPTALDYAPSPVRPLDPDNPKPLAFDVDPFACGGQSLASAGHPCRQGRLQRGWVA